MLIVAIIHFVLAIWLFAIQNWIGSRAYSVGYVKFSLLDDKDEALAINFVIKVFGPVVFLILAVAIFQYSNLSTVNSNVINVIYYYIGIRLLLIFLYERFFVVNWIKIITYYLVVIFISRYICKLPNFRTALN